MRFESLVHEMAVTPPRCASLMAYSSLPETGANARIFPSLQPERIALPLAAKEMHLHVWLGTSMRRSSLRSGTCHTRMSLAQVAKSTERSFANATSWTALKCDVARISKSKSSRHTRYKLPLLVWTKKWSPSLLRASEVMPPLNFFLRMMRIVLVLMSATVPSPAPMMRLPGSTWRVRIMLVTPLLKFLLPLPFGPEPWKSLDATPIQKMSPVAEPRYTCLASGEETEHKKWRRAWPNEMSLGISLRARGSK